MAMIHQYPLQETSGTTAQDAVGSVDATYDGNPALNQAETFSSNPNIKSVLFDPTDLTGDLVIIPATVNMAHAQGSVFLFFKPASTSLTSQHLLWLRSPSFGASIPQILITHDANSASDFSVVFGASADNVTGVDYTYGATQGFTSSRWLIVGVTWDTSGATFHVYDFDTGTWIHHFDDNSGNGLAWPAGNFESLNAFGIGTSSAASPHVYGSHICLYDTALTDAEVEAQTFNPPASALPCSTTFSASELASMRAAAAQIMTCLAEVQEQSLAGNWITIATNVPCNIEISGVRRELDSADNEVVFQSWLVSLAGTVTLPAPTDNKTIRIIVGGLTLQTFQYYQSPDDIVIPLECEEV
jgi:hypothetical protein